MASTSGREKEFAAPALVKDDACECAICLLPCTHPVKLPTCAHIFCFLCVKGAASRSRRCPMCRTAIGSTFFERPDLLLCDKEISLSEGKHTYEWFYEARGGGWWRYEERQEIELEKSFSQSIDRPVVEVLICGHVYVIDLNEMVQFRKDRPAQRRRVRRSLPTALFSRGVAGLHLSNH